MGFDKIKTNPNISGKVYQEIRPKTAKIARDYQRFKSRLKEYQIFGQY